MNGIPLDEETIFYVARRVSDPEARMAYLRQVCGDDTALRDRVEALLRVCEQEASFLESPAVGPPATVAAAGAAHPPERPGTVIGPFKLLEAIGEGGMGAVYMAEQARPVRRKVALKVIKPGMDTKQVIARFEAERQALALMDHPNIARVLDAGTTEFGRPYFVMELVRGIPITEYCDREHLSIAERLDLFVLVCRAVQHAHQKGVIHRDIKPSNVLITLHDGVPVPKVIDFGIAKATGQCLTDRTLYTGFAQLVGTPLYMSPEQAEMSGLDVDTRSDVYSLGVLLYELLTGTTPFDQETMRKAALDEMRRIIREEEPPKPSTRLSSLGATLTTVSANRKLDPRHLGRAVRGELDWIVMRALEKDRQRRYETANDFAADVMRYLTDLPVDACPPSAWYRCAKFARRNSVGLTTGALIGMALVAGAAVSTWQAVRATRAERESRVQTAQARKAVDEMYTQFSEKILGDHPQLDPVQREFLEKALAYYQAFSRERGTGPEIREEAARANSRVGNVRHQLGQYPEALTAYQRALGLDEALVRDFPTRPNPREFLAEDRRRIADLLNHLERFREAQEMIVRAIAAQQELVDGHPAEARFRRDLAECHGYLGMVLDNMGRRAEAEKALEKAHDLSTRLVAEHPDEQEYRYLLGWTDEVLVPVLMNLGRREEAEDALKRSLAHLEKLVSERRGRPQYRFHLAVTLVTLGDLKRDDGKPREAEEAYGRAITIGEALAAEFPDRVVYKGMLANALIDRAGLLMKLGRREEAEVAIKRSLAHCETLVSEGRGRPEHRSRLAYMLFRLGDLKRDDGKPREAVEAYGKGITIGEALAAEFPGRVVDRDNLAVALTKLADLLMNLERREEAENALKRSLAHCETLVSERPGRPEPRSRLAYTLFRLGLLKEAVGKPREAEEAYGEAITIGEALAAEFPGRVVDRDNLAAALSNLAILLKDQGKADEARKLGEQALEIRHRAQGPRHPETWNTVLILTLSILNAPDRPTDHRSRALELTRELTELRPDEQISWKWLGLAEYSNGNWEAAIQAEERCIEIRGDQGWAFQHVVFALAHARQGQMDQAREWFAKARPALDQGRTADTPRWLIDEAVSILGANPTQAEAKSRIAPESTSPPK